MFDFGAMLGPMAQMSMIKLGSDLAGSIVTGQKISNVKEAASQNAAMDAQLKSLETQKGKDTHEMLMQKLSELMR